MDTNIALASLASSRARQIGAEYRCGVHDRPPGVAGEHSQEEYGWTPIFVTSAPHHGLVESYLLPHSRYLSPSSVFFDLLQRAFCLTVFFLPHSASYIMGLRRFSPMRRP